MIIVNTHEAKTRLSELLHIIQRQHETVRICRSGKAIADLIPTVYQAHNPMKQHKELQKIVINYDPVAPLSDDEWSEI